MRDVQKVLLGRTVTLTWGSWTRIFNKSWDYVRDELAMWIEMSDSATFYVSDWKDENGKDFFTVLDDNAELLEFDY